MHTPSLFEEADDVVVDPPPRRARAVVARPTWHVEVSQATFDAWSDATQLAYCAARDERNALKEPDRAGWYHERAAAYREMIK